jgi:hypothetical protein
MPLIDLLDFYDNLYDIAYYFHKEGNRSIERSISETIMQTIKYGTDKHKKKILGIGTYLDYLSINKKIDSEEYDIFIPVLDEWNPKTKDSTIYSKRRIIEQSFLNKTDPENTRAFFISEILKKNYSTEVVENYFKFKKINK